MPILSRFTNLLAYLSALGVVLAFHAYALHLDETSETEPTPVAQRQA
ncbi:hypothetical protein KOL96_13740 [Ralstonia wenshanensis]|nr:hypothetical protein [Ralstonia wenshanensis]UGS92132.1 hypothetical protein KOL96_13740 [Ralstonia wenshanensis]